MKRNEVSFMKFIFALKRKYPMHAWDGQKRNAEHFQSQMEGRPKLDAGKGESVGRKKELTLLPYSCD